MLRLQEIPAERGVRSPLKSAEWEGDHQLLPTLLADSLAQVGVRGGGMTPTCFNRKPYAPGRWIATGRYVQLGQRPAPVYRWVPSRFEDRCAVWDGTGIGPNGERYPIAHGFKCAGCRWLPEFAKAELASVGAAA